MRETNQPSLPMAIRRLLVAAVTLAIVFACVSTSEAGKKRRKRKAAQIEQPAEKRIAATEAQLDRDQRLAELVSEYNDMIDEQRFAEAEILARQAQTIAPKSPIVVTMLSKVKFCQQLVTGKRAVRYEDIPFEDDAPFAEPRRLLRLENVQCEAHSPPSDKHVIRVLEETNAAEPGQLSALYAKSPEKIRIVKQLISQHADPPRHVPLLGPVQLHRETYKCTVHIEHPFTDAKRVDWSPRQNTGQAVHTVYVDQTHIHAADHAIDHGQADETAVSTFQHHALQDLISAEFRLKNAMNRRVALDFEKVPLKQAIAHLAAATNANIHLDERGLHAEGVTADQPISIKLSQQVKLRSALQLILAPLGLDFVIADEVIKVTSARSINDHVYAVAYSVADLVMPIPDTVKISKPPAKTHLASTTAENLQPFYDSLTDLITTTIAPESWDTTGGPAVARAFPTNLSLVVSQTQENHQQLSELLEQLRRLKDTSLVVSIDTFKIPPAGMREIFADRWSDGRPIALSSDAASFLKQALDQNTLVRKTSSPKITIYNGQKLDIPVFFGEESQTSNQRLLLSPRLANDQRSIAIQASVGNELVAAMTNSQSAKLPSTGSLLFDFTDAVGQSNQLSLLPPRKSSADADRVVVMVSVEIVPQHKEQTLTRTR